MKYVVEKSTPPPHHFSKEAVGLSGVCLFWLHLVLTFKVPFQTFEALS